ncbi:metallophosphatase [Gramella sp. GC03-9]|uniref:Metallophosphatase n=1 Tax=Christiangramia oceanisediminis TaxID=2920386 RepID=A0A9X2I7E0_9FLAO|nr:metallophosphatase [Gramella oceanisediminis]MCP9199059.1 metallophosphatase [Gramella oceanisediminis]
MSRPINLLQHFLKHAKSRPLKYLLLLFTISLNAQETNSSKETVHSFYITSNTGLRSNETNLKIFQSIVEDSKKGDSASFLMIGNIVPESGYPDKDDGRDAMQQHLTEHLLEPLKEFKGRMIFTPGVNEWQYDAPDNIDDLESFLQDNSNSELWPNDGCPIESEEIAEGVQLIMIDSQWFIEDWDDHPLMNTKCEIKTRAQFVEEFEDELEDNQRKTILVAVHHPVLTQTKLGFFEKIVGANEQTIRNPQLEELMGILETNASQYADVIFLSGHDRNQQYIEDDGIEQIISGVTEKPEKAKPDLEDGHFASYEMGYAKMNIYKNGSANVEFYRLTNSGAELIETRQIARERPTLADVSWPEEKIGETFTTSVYTEEETDKDWLYKAIWGEHYRPLYSRKFEFPVLYLDTIPGNLEVMGAGGGHQSRSLGFIDEDDHEYTLRAIKKSALRFIQTSVAPTHYVEELLNNTVAERYVQDFYTTAFPYGTFPASYLMDELNIYHPQSNLYYVPKQEALGIFNQEYGNELYMWEYHIGDENTKFYDNAEDILNSSDLYEEMRESKEGYVDEEMFIRVRLLDMLMGDWDRHEGQYEWAEFEDENGRKKYVPIAKDRDQVFPKNDGLALALLKLGFPSFRSMENYDDMIDNPKWFNIAGYPLDIAFIRNSDWEVWKEQANYIQENITDEVIEEAFAVLPEDLANDPYVDEIKSNLRARRGNMEKIAREYYEHLEQFDMFTGTEDDDKFIITRKPNGLTTIVLENEDGKQVAERTYDSNMTREVWVYGLDGDDEFIIKGKGNNLLPLKILGGEEHDVYDFKNKRKAKVYDFKSKDNTIKNPGTRKMLVDSYDINTYDPKKKKIRQFTFMPSADFNSDQGFSLGVSNTYTTKGLISNPFSAQHNITSNYFFATQGFDLSYSGEFAHIFYNWNLGIDAYYSSPNFVINFFGIGNDTEYDDDAVSRDFNRVRIKQMRFSPSLIYRKNERVSFNFRPLIESLNVAYDEDRFIANSFDEDNDIFGRQIYAGGEVNYNYYNKDSRAFPSMGMEFDLTTGYKTNIDGGDNEFVYVNPILSVNYPLHSSGLAAIATKIGGTAILGDNYEFYHAATLGGGDQNSLRAYRNERFNGKYAFFQNIDVRTAAARFKTNFIPLAIGFSAGFDYGRVWTENDNSSQWHTNYGGSFFVNMFRAFTGNLGYYVGDEGGRLNFSFNFEF